MCPFAWGVLETCATAASIEHTAATCCRVRNWSSVCNFADLFLEIFLLEKACFITRMPWA